MKNFLWFLFAFFAIGVGLYPFAYIDMNPNDNLLSSKSPELLSNMLWRIGFITHISLGGLALMIGWVQFSSKMRARNLNLHRQLGKVYTIAVLLSGLAGAYIAIYATGGLDTKLGFSLLAYGWLFFTVKAYVEIRKGNVVQHEHMMIYSYALCFAAVTLRLWLPILIMTFGSFASAYQIVAWLAWVPNLFIAYWIVQRKKLAIG